MAHHLRRMEGRALVDRRQEGKKKRALSNGRGSARARGGASRALKTLIDEHFSGLSVEQRAQLADLLGNLDRSQP